MTAPPGYVEITGSGGIYLDAKTLVPQSTPALTSGRDYFFIASGQHQLAGDGRQADAGFWQPTKTSWQAGTHLHVRKGTVDQINWGNARDASDDSNPARVPEYGVTYHATSTGTLTAVITDSNPADNLGGLTLRVYERQTVWVEADTSVASEDGRATTTFTVRREGGSLSNPVDAYFTLGGSAAASTETDSYYEDGVAKDGADYTVTGATLVGGNVWKVQIPAGNPSADVTIKPLNDAIDEADETATLSLIDSQDVVPGYAAPATNPAARPATTNKAIQGLTISNEDPALDANTLAALDQIKSTTVAVRDAAAEALRTTVVAKPTRNLRAALVAIGDDVAVNADSRRAAITLVNGGFNRYDISIENSRLVVGGLERVAGKRYQIRVTGLTPQNVTYIWPANDPSANTPNFTAEGELNGLVPQVPLVPKNVGFAKFKVEVYLNDPADLSFVLQGTAGNIAFEIKRLVAP